MSWEEQQAGHNGAWHPNQGFSGDYRYGYESSHPSSIPSWSSSSSNPSAYASSSSSYAQNYGAPSYSTPSFSQPSRPLTPDEAAGAAALAGIAFLAFVIWTLRDELLIAIFGLLFAGLAYFVASLSFPQSRIRHGIGAAAPFVLATVFAIYGIASDPAIHDGTIFNLLLSAPATFLKEISLGLAIPGVVGATGLFTVSRGARLAARLYVQSKSFRNFTMATGISVACLFLIGDVRQVSAVAPLSHNAASLSAKAGAYVGIGIGFQRVHDSMDVMSVEPGKPAARGGILIGDVIIAINDVDVRGLTDDAVVGMLRGHVRTPVSVTVRHAGSRTTARLALTREPI